MVEDAVERRALAGRRPQRLQPGAAQSRTGDCLLHRNQRLWPSPRECWVGGTLAALGHAQHGRPRPRMAVGAPIARARTQAWRHSTAPPRCSAPRTRRSRACDGPCVPTCGAVVWANHCCGTTCPSDPIASPATRTQARSTILARLARSAKWGKPASPPLAAAFVPPPPRADTVLQGLLRFPRPPGTGARSRVHGLASRAAAHAAQ